MTDEPRHVVPVVIYGEALSLRRRNMRLAKVYDRTRLHLGRIGRPKRSRSIGIRVCVPGMFTLTFREMIAIRGVTEMTVNRDTSCYSLDILRAVCFFVP